VVVEVLYNLDLEVLVLVVIELLMELLVVGVVLNQKYYLKLKQFIQSQ
jgi:hypothetical protein